MRAVWVREVWVREVWVREVWVRQVCARQLVLFVGQQVSCACHCQPLAAQYIRQPTQEMTLTHHSRTRASRSHVGTPAQL